jgi:sulfatase maturation enzyme AslB (radical SAM superfamily)
MSNLPSNACAYPFKAAMLQHGLPATPCCRFHHRFLSELDKDTVTPFADIQETMLRNEWHPGCYKCKADEDAGKESMRTQADNFFSDFTDSAQLEYLEITVGRLCNLKCITCGPEFSHTWDDDTISLGLESQDYINKLRQVQELDLDNLDLNKLTKLKNIKVTGGEPFLHRQFLRFVVNLAESGMASNVSIEIFTNCTWYPEKVEMDALLQFKQVRITTSLDGYGVVNDFVRYPSNWKRVEETLDKWIAVREQYGGPESETFIITAAPTVSVLNACYMFEFMHWARVHKQIEVVLQTVYEPNYLSITHWPDWFKSKLKYTVDAQFEGFNNRYAKLIPAHELITKLCATPSSEIDKSSEYLHEINRVAKHRGQDVRTLKKFCDLINLEATRIA